MEDEQKTDATLQEQVHAPSTNTVSPPPTSNIQPTTVSTTSATKKHTLSRDLEYFSVSVSFHIASFLL